MISAAVAILKRRSWCMRHDIQVQPRSSRVWSSSSKRPAGSGDALQQVPEGLASSLNSAWLTWSLARKGSAFPVRSNPDDQYLCRRVRRPRQTAPRRCLGAGATRQETQLGEEADAADPGQTMSSSHDAN